MLSAGRLVGLDFGSRSRRPVAQDVCRFLVHLDVSRWLATAEQQMDEIAGDRRDVEAFARGFGPEYLPTGSYAQLVMLNEIVRRIAIRSHPNAEAAWGRSLELSRLHRRCEFLMARMA